MVIRISIDDLDRDDDRLHLEGGPKNEVRYPTIQDLLAAWLPSKEEGGYDAFIERYGLQGVVSKQQLEQLLTDDKTRMGKRLAGILSIIVPSEFVTWTQTRNIYDYAARRDHLKEIDIDPVRAQAYIDRLAATPGLEFKHLLKLHRRAALLWQEELEEKSGIPQTTISSWELGYKKPDEPYNTHKLCDALEVSHKTRFLIFTMLRKEALHGLSANDAATRHQELNDMVGGGNLVGLLLYYLRKDKGWSLRDLADKAGISPQAVGAYEAGVLPPTQVIRQLCDALEVTPGIRLYLFHAASKGALSDLDVGNKQYRESLKTMVGGRTLFAALLYTLRNKKGWLQKELGEKTGIKESALKDYEAGHAVPDSATINKLCEGFEVDAETKELLLKVSAEKKASINLRRQEGWSSGRVCR